MSASAIERREALSDPLARYERMVEIRQFEERVNALFATGSIHGTTHLCMGQEALAVGLAATIRPTDPVTATYRGHGVALALGMQPDDVLAEIMGRAAGCTGGLGGSMHLCDVSVGLLPTFAIIGGGLPVAAGAALAAQCREDASVAVAVFGDGAANIGAFHETLNLASIWKLPVVFLLDNNLYAEYSRIDVTTPIEDLHRRADSYAMASEVVDGMDVDAVMATVGAAVDRARGGEGPTLVEAKTYRFAGHSRADTAPYRPDGELDDWQSRDPVRVTRESLLAAGGDEAELAAVETRVADGIDRLVDHVSALPGPEAATMFDNVWAKPATRPA